MWIAWRVFKDVQKRTFSGFPQFCSGPGFHRCFLSPRRGLRCLVAVFRLIDLQPSTERAPGTSLRPCNCGHLVPPRAHRGANIVVLTSCLWSKMCEFAWIFHMTMSQTWVNWQPRNVSIQVGTLLGMPLGPLWSQVHVPTVRPERVFWSKAYIKRYIKLEEGKTGQ